MQASLRDFMRISIHALREEGDATRETVDDEEDISIHALREEGDVSLRFAVTVKRHFYPRPPRGGRPLRKYFIFGEIKFLSTPSARRATT